LGKQLFFPRFPGYWRQVNKKGFHLKPIDKTLSKLFFDKFQASPPQILHSNSKAATKQTT
jgi:hypothetical protein